MEKSIVAELPRSAIDSMTPEELIRVIHAARLPPACGDLPLELLEVDELRNAARRKPTMPDGTLVAGDT